MMTKQRQKLYLIDGSSYIFRAYYAIRPLSNSKGLPTNALYGFTRMILKLIKEEKPDKLAVVFDTVEPTFRDEMYEDYKANREEPPSDLVAQFDYFEPIVSALNIQELSLPGFEADDVIGTVAKKAVEDGYDVVVVTGDKDFMQLVGEHVKLYDTMKEKRIGEDDVKKKFGVKPERVIDVMGFIGDSSDNIPGVSGIGFKSAVNLIAQFGSMENVFSNIDKISNAKIKNALKEGKDKAELSKKLATIKVDVPLKFDWKDFDVLDPDAVKMKKLFSELEFFKLLRELLPTEEAEEKEGYLIVSGSDDLMNLGKKLRSAERCALYFFGDAGRGAFPFLGIGISFSKDNAVYIPVAHETLEEFPNVDKKAVALFLKELGENKLKYIYDAKDALRNLKLLGVSLEKVFDVRLMSYVLNPSYPADVVTLAQQIVGMHDLANVAPTKTGKKREIKVVTMKAAANEACLAADAILRLANVFEEDLKKERRLGKIFNDVEQPLMTVLLKMEEKGILVDVKKLKSLSLEYGEKISELEKKIYKDAGEEFAINSPKQLAHILFERLKLPVIKKTKTGFSTDAGVLEELANEYDLPKLILEYRSLTKLKSTYIDVLPGLADGNNRIHTTFNQAVTATGRLSSSNPNLQNVPARTEEGLRIRSAFVADVHCRLVSADYSQIELRILAHISEEPALVEAFENGVDIHSVTAAKLFGVSEEEVDGKMRAQAKTVNFGVLYGQAAYGLSQQLGIKVDDADEYIKNYYKNYPRVLELKERILKDAEKNGYVETIFGRRRYIPDILSANKGVKAFAERTAFNAVFQGTAADIIKMAMIELDQILEKEFPDVFMLLQVHDELVFECPEQGTGDLLKIVREKMCEVVKLKVPLEVDIGIGDNWAECK